jgi:hypothetical protein
LTAFLLLTLLFEPLTGSSGRVEHGRRGDDRREQRHYAGKARRDDEVPHR